MNDLDDKPWYRQFWPWFLIALPASAVVAGIATYYVALPGSQDLVVDDYYKAGLAINKTLDREKAARALGLSAGMSYDEHSGRLVVTLQQAAREPAPPGRLRLLILHPTLTGRDRRVELRATPSQPWVFSGRIRPLGKADWYLRLEPLDRSWRLDGRLLVPGERTARLTAGQ